MGIGSQNKKLKINYTSRKESIIRFSYLKNQSDTFFLVS